MTMNVSEWSISRPAPAIVVFAILLVLGAYSLATLPITRFPDIDMPIISVSIVHPGATPSDLEKQVAIKVEDAIADIAGLRNLQTILDNGKATFTAEFRDSVETGRALEDIQNALARIRGDLPQTIDEPIVEHLNVRDLAIATYAISSREMTLDQLSAYVDERIVKSVQSIRGVGRVIRLGGAKREIRVRLDADELTARGLSAAGVNEAVRALSENHASGQGVVAGMEQPIRTLAQAATVDDLNRVGINVGDDRHIRLGDIARVEESIEDPVSFARLNDGNPTIVFSVFAEKGAREIDMSHRVADRIAALSNDEPSMTYKLIDENFSYTYGNFKSTMQLLLEGAFCTIVVVYIFLRDWRSTLIAALSLPLAVIPTFWVMSMMGFSLNLVSLLGLTLAIGLLVDDSIVEIENIARHLQMGKTPFRAAIDATEEIGTSVIAISLTIVAVFVPVTMVDGLPGQYFREFGLSVAAATLLSLLGARLVTPMLAAHLMRSGPRQEKALPGGIQRAYFALLALSVRRLPLFRPVKGRGHMPRHLDMAYVTVGLGIVIVTLSVAVGLPGLARGFVPKENGTRILVAVEVPVGTSHAGMLKKSEEISRLISTIPEIKQVYSYRLPSGGKGAARDTFMVQLMLAHKSERARSQADIAAEVAALLTSVPDIRSHNLGQTGTRHFSVALMSRNPESLLSAAETLEAGMREMPLLRNVSTRANALRPEIQVVPDPDQSAQLGIDANLISHTIRVATIGEVTRNLATLNDQDRQTQIRVQVQGVGGHDLDMIRNLPLLTRTGHIVPVGAVATVKLGYGPATIERRDGMRRVELGADLANGATVGQALANLMERVEETPLPLEVTMEPTGDAERMREFFTSFAAATALALLAVFAVLVLLLGNPFQPATVLLSLPLSLGGVVAALQITGHALTMPVLIGALMLMGIVAKNAILVVDVAGRMVSRGTAPRVAAVLAAEQRARPIIMTTAAMVAGMTPVALGLGDGGEFRAPMAVAVIGGLIVSTALSLVFVPSLFLVVEQIRTICMSGLNAIFARSKGTPDFP